MVLLNDPSYVEAAKGLAQIAIKNQIETDSRIDEIFKIAFSRVASEEEKQIISGLIESSLADFKNQPDEAKKLLGSPADMSEDSAIELAAWTSACRAVINMHEFILRK